MSIRLNIKGSLVVRVATQMWSVILAILCSFAQKAPPDIAAPREIPKTYIKMHPDRGKLILGLLIGTGLAYLIVGFLEHFYPTIIPFVVLALFLNVLCITAACWIAGEIMTRLRTSWRAELPNLFILLFAWFLAAGAMFVSNQYPELYDSQLIFMDPTRLPLFLVLVGPSFPLACLLLRRIPRAEALSLLSNTIRRNLPGLLLSIPFFFTYFTFAQVINFPGHYTLDQYFDFDISLWMTWLSSDAPSEVTHSMVRSVHPAILLYLRPVVWFLSLLLNGDRLHATFLMQALAGAFCVFLAWNIVERTTRQVTYALLMACLLGVSTSHLLHGSMLETYIYSALGLLIFVKLLQNESISLLSSFVAGLFIFGITVTNLIQAAILYFVKQPRIKIVLQFLLVVIGLSLLLNVIQSQTYSFAEPLWPSNLQKEKKYMVNFLGPSWRTIGRITLTTRAVFLYGIVAPRPFILDEELGTKTPNFRTVRIATGNFYVADYSGLADLTAKVWILVLVTAIILFIWRYIKNCKPRLITGLALCLGFNLVLHFIYGGDPMLYSPDWVYALVLFVALSFEVFARHRWFQLAWGIFLVLLGTVNFGLLNQIMDVSTPFYGR